MSRVLTQSNSTKKWKTTWKFFKAYPSKTHTHTFNHWRRFKILLRLIVNKLFVILCVCFVFICKLKTSWIYHVWYSNSKSDVIIFTPKNDHRVSRKHTKASHFQCVSYSYLYTHSLNRSLRFNRSLVGRLIARVFSKHRNWNYSKPILITSSIRAAAREIRQQKYAINVTQSKVQVRKRFTRGYLTFGQIEHHIY